MELPAWPAPENKQEQRMRRVRFSVCAKKIAPQVFLCMGYRFIDSEKLSDVLVLESSLGFVDTKMHKIVYVLTCLVSYRNWVS